MSATTTLGQCQNCGHRLRPWDKFCSQCGQDTLDHPPSLWEFVHEFLLHYVAFEGKLWKSLWGLLARPGFLTAEYLAGRKQRYVLPLRLILTLGLVFFMALKLGADSSELVQLDGAGKTGIYVATSASAVRPAPVAEAASAFQADLRKDGVGKDGVGKGDDQAFTEFIEQLPAPVAQAMERSRQRFKADAKAESQRVGARILALAPYAVLISLPFYAGLLALVYWSRRLPYGAHFVFAMHLHAAWYAVLLVGQLPGWVFATFATLWANAYPVLAIKRVYGGAWWSTLLRAALLLLLHSLLLLLGFALLSVVSALS